MVASIRLTQQEARRLAVRAQLLGGTSGMDAKTAVLHAIERLGYVQIDTISVVERAHHHTLWTRVPSYTPATLHALQAVDRTVFEYWTHALSVVPMSDYAYYRERMERFRNGGTRWTKEWRAANGALLERVLERVRAEGALTSKDFAAPPGHPRGTWWDWKPAKVALEVLFRQGELMIAERRGFQKAYDLTERVLPSDVDTAVPTPEERATFHAQRALAAHGVLTEREIASTLRLANGQSISTALGRLMDERRVLSVAVEGSEDPQFALAETMEQVDEHVESDTVRFLSPFDNLIIQRSRVERLFDFSYSLECYLPPAKRVVGYFVHPILWKDRLVGRIDPKADRATGTLHVRRLLFEDAFSEYDDVMRPLAEALVRYARFNGCREIVVEAVAPARPCRGLRAEVKRAIHSMEQEKDSGM